MGLKHLVSCAATKVVVSKNGEQLEELIIPDVCHFGRNFQSICSFLKNQGYSVKNIHTDESQGFLDESGLYLTRSEAYKVAKESGQPFNDKYTLPGKQLDSSCIRHFPDNHKFDNHTFDKNEALIDALQYIIDEAYKQNSSDTHWESIENAQDLLEII